MQLYWVVGGQYDDTTFQKPLKDLIYEGPFKTYEQAKKVWTKLAWQTVDEANTRFRIEAIDPDEAPNCTD